MKQVFVPVFLFLLLLSCQAPLTVPGESGDRAQLSLVFDTPASSPWPSDAKAPIAFVQLSYETPEGPAVTKLAVTSRESGYETEALSLPPGSLTVTQMLALDSLNQAYGVVPAAGSFYAEEVSPAPQDTVPFSIDVSGAQTKSIEFRSVGLYTTPEDYGYSEFPAPLSVPAMDVSYRVVNESGQIIPHFLQAHAISRTSGGGGSSLGWGDNPIGVPEPRTLYQGLSLSNPLGYQGTNQLVYFKLKVGAYGYEDSPVLYYFPGDLDVRRQNSPVLDIVLRSEPAVVVLQPAGTDEAGLHRVRARLASSQFLEAVQAAAGATADDKYSYTIGFTLTAHKLKSGILGWVPVSLLKTPTPNPISSTFYMAPYNSSVAQEKEAYRDLQAELILKDEAAWADFNDDSVPKTVQVYVEILMLKGDGSDVIQSDDDFLGFETKVLKIAPEQIELES